MAKGLSEEQTLLEKTLWIISSVIRVEQIEAMLTWVKLYRKRLQVLHGKVDVDLPQEVYKRLDQKIRLYGGKQEPTITSHKTDPSRISNRYRLREKVENWEQKKEASKKR